MSHNVYKAFFGRQISRSCGVGDVILPTPAADNLRILNKIQKKNYETEIGGGGGGAGIAGDLHLGHNSAEILSHMQSSFPIPIL